MCKKSMSRDESLEKELIKSKEAIQVRDEFLCIASHELKEPLTSLVLQNQLLQAHVENSDKVILHHEQIKTLLAHSKQQLERLQKRVDQLMDVSKIQAGRFELQRKKVNLSHLVRDLVNQFSEQIFRDNSKVRFRAYPSVLGFWDPIRIEQVVVNLLLNAIKYGSGKPIYIRVTKTPNEAILAVKDQGIGIKKEHLKRIFFRFERVVSSHHSSGLGLGLYITRKIIEEHHGTVEVRSRPKKGTLFLVRLPLDLEKLS
jgi:signal transduction histidine kinase